MRPTQCAKKVITLLRNNLLYCPLEGPSDMDMVNDARKRFEEATSALTGGIGRDVEWHFGAVEVEGRRSPCWSVR